MEQEAQSFRDHLKSSGKSPDRPAHRSAQSCRMERALELEMVVRWKRHGGELLLAVLDIDHFKRIIDGHTLGRRQGIRIIIAGELSKRPCVNGFYCALWR